MTVPEIIAALTPYTGHFPKAAVEAAIAQREEVTPHLLRALEEIAEAPEKFAAQQDMLVLFASYLLAQFRDKRAYRPLTKILAAPGDTADKLFGETITERIENILASVYDGDPEPIKRLVEGEEVYEFVRGAAVDTFMVLTNTGQIPRQEVVDYYRELFRGKLRREYNQVWNALTTAVADLPAPELIEDLRKTFSDDLVDPGYADLEELERDAGVPFEKKEEWKREKLTLLISDTVSEMAWWAAFEADRPERSVFGQEPVTPVLPLPPIQRDEQENSDPQAAPSAGIRRSPKIGRNDFCPCGSGKKYKKCCLGK
ncbi:MAG: DUF1186 domain-containing protein [Limisphaerales bacterium]